MGEISQKDIVGLFDGRLHDTSRYLYPSTAQSVEARVVERFAALRRTAGGLALVDGAFDVPHNNHEWYLRHCKMIGAHATLKATSGHDVAFDELIAHSEANPEFLSQAKLAVTVDADSKVAAKKSGLSEKGGVTRPIYPWSARADRLAGYHFAHAGRLHQTVDLVTVEGDNVHIGTPLESSLALAAFLKSEKLLDTFIVFGEHSATVDEADALDLEPIIIPETPYELNPQTGTSWSSSDIIRRAQGKPVPIPITRPDGL